MDTKALAKSKRAHSKKHHQPNPKAKAKAQAQASSASVGTGSGKKPDGEGDKKISHSHFSKELPSNWDRYEDNNGSDPDDPQVTSAAPKSKGADYAYLIAEAKATCSSETFTLLKNPPDDFGIGLGPLLSVKGERMLSWFSEDNFLLDYKDTDGSCEASFLSLNLDVLAKQLEKADLSELLFIEPDLLTPESVSNLQEIIEKVPECTLNGSKTTEASSDVFDFNPISKERNILRCDENVLSESSNNRFFSTPVSKDIDHSLDGQGQLNKSKKPTSDLSPDPAAMEPSGFKAAAAEAELDMLLDSFSETNISDSDSFVLNSGAESSHLSMMLGGSSFLPESFPMKHVKKVGDPEHFNMTVTIDDDLDDLLKESSNVMDVNRKSTLHELNTASHDVSASDPDSKSKVLDDFSSWLDTI